MTCNDLLTMVNDLNTQVLNIAGKITENAIAVFGQSAMAKKPVRYNFDVTFANELVVIFGRRFVIALNRTNIAEDSTAVLLAIQSLLVNGMYTLLSTWPFKPFTESSNTFWELYNSMRRSGKAYNQCVHFVTPDEAIHRGSGGGFLLASIRLQIPPLKPKCLQRTGVLDGRQPQAYRQNPHHRRSLYAYL